MRAKAITTSTPDGKATVQATGLKRNTKYLVLFDEVVTCTWTRDYDEYFNYLTSCKNAFELNEGTPAENHMQYCCFCGEKIEEVEV